MLAATAGKATGNLLRKLGIYDQVTSVAGEISRIVSGVSNFVMVLVVLSFLAAMFYGCWTVVDEAGWISHNRDTTITAQSDWLVGESKVCISFPLDAEFAAYVGAEKNDVTHRMNCDKGPDHEMPLTFWGRVKRPEHRAAGGVNWRCVKKSDGFVCYDLN
jgi:hypothetical protein